MVGYVFSLCVIAASGRFVSQSGGRQAGIRQLGRQAGRQAEIPLYLNTIADDTDLCGGGCGRKICAELGDI